jgi:hypothetical protein
MRRVPGLGLSAHPSHPATAVKFPAADERTSVQAVCTDAPQLLLGNPLLTGNPQADKNSPRQLSLEVRLSTEPAVLETLSQTCLRRSISEQV